MNIWKKIKLANLLCLALVLIALGLFYTPLTSYVLPGFQQPLAGYLILAVIFYLLLLPLGTLNQLQKSWRLVYKSYLAQDNTISRQLIKPGLHDVKTAFKSSFAPKKFLLKGLLLILIFYLNYLLLFKPDLLESLPHLLFAYEEDGSLNKNSVWLALCTFMLLLTCLIIIRQYGQLKQGQSLANRQNLIINAHSCISLANLCIIFTDSKSLLFSSQQLHYILSATPPGSVIQPRGQALVNFRINIKLNNDYSITEFFIRKLSVFIQDGVIECENYQSKFYQIFAVDNEFMLNFFLRFADTDPQQLAQKFLDCSHLKIYYNFIIKNSFGVITDIYGSTVYEKNGPATGDSLQYINHDAKANQYFYI